MADPGPLVTGKVYAHGSGPVADDWRAELNALDEWAWAKRAFGEAFLKQYLAVKKTEYRQIVREVGGQDWRWSLNQA